ncbi:energy transducer TonB [Sphingobium amiense]|uniref:Protein TonB n=1 Tax=Sphingobium amiense TaxID=135719 RepID=A0A494W9K2_9SPHN|nr:energy transducer TonB [Sphingobium amiense]BBD99277.1 energy transducer TonB [Sphingobium amiense]
MLSIGLRTGAEAQSRYGAGRRSPLGLGGTVAVHALLVAGFLLLPKEVIDIVRPSPPISTYAVPEDPPPPENRPDKPVDAKMPVQPQPQPQRPTATDSEITLPRDAGLTGGGGDLSKPLPPYFPPPLPPADPVLTDAQIDPRALPAFQPDYPGAMIRQGLDGKVTVRVSIGADGRVTAIEKISASDDSFWETTQRHALRKWRFRPATRDGVPVASTKVLTVRFTLTDR